MSGAEAESLAAKHPPLPFRTPAAWAAAQLPHVAELLVEQAHLEKKAAAAALSFLFRVPCGNDVQRGLSALAREELVHFERTLKLLSMRSIPFGTLPPSRYAELLKAGMSPKLPLRLVDELLIGAVIEARSCERMQLLALALQPVDEEVAEFYADLVAAEARHEVLYIEIASVLQPAEVVAARWRALGEHEASVLQGLPWSPRLHSGLVPEFAGGP